MNDDIFNHDLVSETASTPNAAELNAALPLLSSASTSTFDAFDDLAGLDINQTNFSELDDEEQDIAHIILSDPSLLGLDCLIGAGPPKRRIGGTAQAQAGQMSRGGTAQAQAQAGQMSRGGTAQAQAGAGQMSRGGTTPYTTPTVQHQPLAQHTTTSRMAFGNGGQLGYAHRVIPSSAAGNSRAGEGRDDVRGFERSRASSPPKAYVRPPTMRKACDLCHQAKQKCSGERPSCERCRAGNWACHYAIRQRRRAPGSVKPAPPTTTTTTTTTTGAQSLAVKGLPGARSTPAGQVAQRSVQPARTFSSGTVNTGSTAVRPQAGMPSIVQKVVLKPIVQPAPLRPTQPMTSTAANGATHDNITKRDPPSQSAVQPLVRSIAGPIKAGMPNFGHFSANAFLAKKFPGLMPGASRPIVSPGQLPYMSKAAAAGDGQHEVPGSPSGSFGKAPKRPTKKRKTKNGGGVASAEAENDLNVMDGFGYLYGFQETSSSDPGLGKQGSYAYHGPVGWASGRSAGQLPGSNRERQVSENWFGNGGEEEPALRAEEYLQVIHEDGLLADLDLDSHAFTLGPAPHDAASRTGYSPSHTQTSDDVLQDVASILDPRFTDRNATSSATIKAEDVSHSKVDGNSQSAYSFAAPTNENDNVLHLLASEFGYSTYGDANTNGQASSQEKQGTISSGDGSMTGLDAALFGDGDHVSAANLAAFSDQIFHTTFSSHDSQRSEASSVYQDSGEGQLPDFMMEDLTDFAAWSAQAEQPFAASEASSRFGTNPNQSPVNAFQNPFGAGLDVAGLDDLIQLNAKNEEEQFALDLATMFPDPEDGGPANPAGTGTEDVIMDGGMMNIEELEQALNQHMESTSTPVAGDQDLLPSPEVVAKIEVPDTPLSSAQTTLPVDGTPDDAIQAQVTPLSHAATTPGFTQSKSTCQHEVDISQTVRALSRLYLPTLSLGQLMPLLTRALEILVSLHSCTLCPINPSQTIPQLALLSRTCSILLRPHPLTPSPLPLTIAGGRTTFTGLAPEVEVHIIDILWANWRSHSLQKVFTDLERRVHEHAQECARKRQDVQRDTSGSADSARTHDGPTAEELRCHMMTLALKRFRAKVR